MGTPIPAVLNHVPSLSDFEAEHAGPRGGQPCSICRILNANPRVREQMIAGRRKLPATTFETMAKFLEAHFGLTGRDTTQKVSYHMKKHEGIR